MPPSIRIESPRNDRLEALLAGELELPLLPAVVLEVLAASADEACGAGELAALLQRDPPLAANVLRVVNSAAHAPREPIASLPHAVSRLGLRSVRDIAVAVAVRGRVFGTAGYGPELRAMWEHAALSAVWAQELARARRKNVETAFLVGLLHDIGKPVVLETAARLAGATPGNTAGHGATPPFAELAPLLDALHAEVGARALCDWGLPEVLWGPVAHHHDPGAAGEHADLARLGYFADRLAHAHFASESAPHSTTEEAATPAGVALGWLASDPHLDELGLYADEIAALWTRRDAFATRAGGLL